MIYDVEIRKEIVRKIQIEADNLDAAHAIGLSMLDFETSEAGYEFADAQISVFEQEDKIIPLDAHRRK